MGNDFFYGDEENGRCACINRNSTTADQGEIRKENLVSALSDKNVAGRRLRMNKKNNVTDKNIKIKNYRRNYGKYCLLLCRR